MRTRYFVSLVLLGTVSILFLLRQHIRDLGEIARTYSVFHSYIKHNPDVLFGYPSSSSPRKDISLAEPVPKIIHQIFLSDGKTNASISKYEPAIESCKSLHPSWKAYMWTDSDARDFMSKHYPEIYPHYIGYKQNIQRANVLRYALLHHYGGVYVDLDVTCRVALDAQLGEGSGVPTLTHLPLLTPGAYPAGVNNAFILSRPKHPFLTELLRKVPSRDISWPMPYVENMLSTGCGFFGNVWMSFALRLERRKINAGVRKEDQVYILADQNGNMESQMLRGKVVTPLFEHGGASSWHGWDAAMLVLIGKHYGLFAMGLVLAISLVVAAAWKLTRRSRQPQRRRASWSSLISRFSLERRSLEKRAHEDEEKGLIREE
ncbi:Inositol phosphoceramide mannosyltransferase 3 [Pseudocercospora fuligena]|uniref:Inositol phosphoceramide mannosyltransferase 3 n=1 Tax=Pseudocercospora fuligena TaxID=685502 RepID=A0A8H6RQK3_9PEZI|nr:Inositol phosphoceramide mannosyltransferase 3 [Pseudocercospora fuligena]